jgi:hypothetical protein
MKISISIYDGTVDIDADPEHITAATDHALRLIAELSSVKRPSPPQAQQNNEVETMNADNAEAVEDSSNTKAKQKRRGTSKSKSWQYIHDLVDKSGWKKIHEYYEEKKPKTQNEQVAVFCAILRELTKRDSFDGHEIHSCFKALGKKTPANLAGVFSNMGIDGLGHSSEGKFHLDFKGEQLVEHDLPRSSVKDD